MNISGGSPWRIGGMSPSKDEEISSRNSEESKAVPSLRDALSIQHSTSGSEVTEAKADAETDEDNTLARREEEQFAQLLRRASQAATGSGLRTELSRAEADAIELSYEGGGVVVCEDSDGEILWEVEKILEERTQTATKSSWKGKKGQEYKEYRVKWKNYNREDPDWYHESQFPYDMIEESDREELVNASAVQGKDSAGANGKNSHKAKSSARNNSSMFGLVIGEDSDGEPLWEVEEVLEERTQTAEKTSWKGKKGQTYKEFRVKWKDYDKDDPIWYHESQFPYDITEESDLEVIADTSDGQSEDSAQAQGKKGQKAPRSSENENSSKAGVVVGEDSDGEPLWEVEAILQERTQTAKKTSWKGKTGQSYKEYRIKWKGYDQDDPNWYHESQFPYDIREESEVQEFIDTSAGRGKGPGRRRQTFTSRKNPVAATARPTDTTRGPGRPHKDSMAPLAAKRPRGRPPKKRINEVYEDDDDKIVEFVESDKDCGKPAKRKKSPARSLAGSLVKSSADERPPKSPISAKTAGSPAKRGPGRPRRAGVVVGVDVDGERLWEVEKVLDERTCIAKKTSWKGKRGQSYKEYQVKWKAYNQKDPNWYHESQFPCDATEESDGEELVDISTVKIKDSAQAQGKKGHKAKQTARIENSPKAGVVVGEDLDGEPLWEVEAILEERTLTAKKSSWRGKRGQTYKEYQVKWKDYKKKDFNWYHEAQFPGDIIQEFQKGELSNDEIQNATTEGKQSQAQKTTPKRSVPAEENPPKKRRRSPCSVLEVEPHETVASPGAAATKQAKSQTQKLPLFLNDNDNVDEANSASSSTKIVAEEWKREQPTQDDSSNAESQVQVARLEGVNASSSEFDNGCLDDDREQQKTSLLEMIRCPACSKEFSSSRDSQQCPFASQGCTHTVCVACVQTQLEKQHGDAAWLPCPVECCKETKAFASKGAHRADFTMMRLVSILRNTK